MRFLTSSRWALSVVVLGCATGSKPVRFDAVTPGPTIASWEREILALEEQRSTADGVLAKLAATAPKAEVRARAVLALGRIQDLSMIPPVTAALKDADATVRTQAAFAAGLFALAWQGTDEAQKTELSRALLDAEANEKLPDVRTAMLEALGKVADLPSVERLAARLESDVPTQTQAFFSLGVAAKRGAKLPAPVLNAATQALSSSKGSTHLAAAYVLMQSKLPEAREGLLKGLADADAETRGLCAKGLGDVGQQADVTALGALLADADARVSAEATRSLSKMLARSYAAKDGKPAAPPIEAALRALALRPPVATPQALTAAVMPRLVLAQAGLPAPAVPVLNAVRASLAQEESAKLSSNARSALANLDCRFAAAIDRAQGFLHQVFNCGNGRVPEAHWLALGLSELSQAPPLKGKEAARVEEALPYLTHAEAKVRSAAVSAIASGKGAKAVDALKALLKSEDVVLVGSAAAGLATLKDKAGTRAVLELAKAVPVPELAPALADALTEIGSKEAIPLLEAWLASPHAVVRHGAAAALSTLGGQPVAAPHVAHAPYPALSEEWRQPAVEVKTEKGSFVIRLYGHDAPRTVANFVELAKKGFYKNLTFHRVVPNFVVQGGDPRGDGEGGPGYLIPCEITAHPYRRGTVGMALSGKDTGGSQFFVTTSAQPHLDGRYTSFGDVVSGMNVVDGLLEGDAIIDVSPLREREK